MTQNRLGNLNSLLEEAKSAAREVEKEKMEENVKEALAKATKDPLSIYKAMKWYPRFVVWELTLACNMSCAHCGSSAGTSRPDEMNLDEMLQVCDELGELECERLTLLGGEPLIHPHWKDIAARLQANGVRVNVITNGWTLYEEKLCDMLKKTGLSIIGISIDGLEKSHDKMRRPGSFKRIEKGMDLLKERGVSMAVCTVITSDSIKDLDGLYDFIIDKGVKVWQIQIASPLGRLKPDDPLLIQPEQIKDVYDVFYRKRKLNHNIHIDFADDIGYYPPWEEGYIRNTRKGGTLWVGCHAGIQIMGIDSNGNIKGCQSLPSRPEFIEGNIRRNSLKEIWQNPNNFKYNRQFSITHLSGYCAECKYGPLCKAGCSSTAISHTGNKGNNPMCIYRVMMEKKK